MIMLCFFALLIVLMLSFSVGIHIVLLAFCVMQWILLLMMRGFLVMFSSGKNSCYRFARDFCRARPSAQLCLALGLFHLHYFALDYEQGEYYTVEWKVDFPSVPFLFLFARFCVGRPYIRYGDVYRDYPGIVVHFKRRYI